MLSNPVPPQSRPNIFDLEIRRPELLYKAVVEVNERVVLDKGGEGGWEAAAAVADGDADTTGGAAAGGAGAAAVVQGVTGEGVRVVKEPDLAAVRVSLQAVLDQGITSLAVVFLHRWVTPRSAEPHRTAPPPAVVEVAESMPAGRGCNHARRSRTHAPCAQAPYHPCDGVSTAPLPVTFGLWWHVAKYGPGWG